MNDTAYEPRELGDRRLPRERVAGKIRIPTAEEIAVLDAELRRRARPEPLPEAPN